MKQSCRGITLIELLVALTAIAVIAAIALPAWSRASAAASSLDARTSLVTAVLGSVRNAGLRGGEIVMCPSANGATCLDSHDWSPGWIVFDDVDGDRTLSPNEQRLLREPALNDGVRVLSTTGRRRLVFQPGGGNAGSNVTFTVCDRRGASYATTLVLANTGHIRQAAASSRQAAACLADL